MLLSRYSIAIIFLFAIKLWESPFLDFEIFVSDQNSLRSRHDKPYRFYTLELSANSVDVYIISREINTRAHETTIAWRRQRAG